MFKCCLIIIQLLLYLFFGRGEITSYTQVINSRPFLPLGERKHVIHLQSKQSTLSIFFKFTPECYICKGGPHSLGEERCTSYTQVINSRPFLPLNGGGERRKHVIHLQSKAIYLVYIFQIAPIPRVMEKFVFVLKTLTLHISSSSKATGWANAIRENQWFNSGCGNDFLFVASKQDKEVTY